MPLSLDQLMESVAQQIQSLATQDVPASRRDWIEPFAARGNEEWRSVELSVLDRGSPKREVRAQYRIHADTTIMTLVYVLERLRTDPNERLVMEYGRQGGDSLALLSEWSVSDERRSKPGLRFYFERFA